MQLSSRTENSGKITTLVFRQILNKISIFSLPTFSFGGTENKNDANCLEAWDDIAGVTSGPGLTALTSVIMPRDKCLA